MERERKVDVTKMSESEVDVLSAQLGIKIRSICEEAVAKANQLLNIYGASAKMQIEITQLPTNLAKSMSPAKKQRKPSKKANLKTEHIL